MFLLDSLSLLSLIVFLFFLYRSSFLSLENKINALRDDFENLVNAPKTGEAHFTFDGSSKVIELKGYNNTLYLYLPSRCAIVLKKID